MRIITGILFCVLLSFAAVGDVDAAPRGRTTCESIKPYNTPINVNLTVMDPVYDLTKTTRELQRNIEKMVPTWLRDNQVEALWQAVDGELEAYAIGGWGRISDVQVEYKPLDKYGVYYCPFVKEISVEMVYRTLVFISSANERGTCAFDLVNGHVMSHHNTGKDVLTLYKNKMKKDLSVMVMEMETKAGYLKHSQLKPSLAEMQQGLLDVVDVFFTETIQKEALKYNELVDAPEKKNEAIAALGRCKKQLREKPRTSKLDNDPRRQLKAIPQIPPKSP